MNIRYHINPSTQLPHIYDHNVSEAEVEDILHNPLETKRGRNDSFIATGMTAGGRCLSVVYVRDPQPNSVFVITAYDVTPRGIRALRRRKKRKGKRS